MKDIALRDGRRLAWHEWGAEGGSNILFCPGAGMAGPLPFGEEAATAMGLRILSVDRPGLGWSDSDPAKSFDSWVSDIRQLLAALNQAAVPVISFSQGAPFAYALAAAGLANQLSIVAGQDELADPRVMANLPEPVAQFVGRAGREPNDLESEIMASASADWLWSMIEMMSSPVDRAFYAREDFAPRYRSALEAGFRNGAAGYARDTILALSRWPWRLEDISCHVDLWYGLEDTSPVHAPDHGSILAKRLPRADHHLVKDEGSSLLWTAADSILGRIKVQT
jgi:pimeloyl-ACP methyl ester carboxylesterase